MANRYVAIYHDVDNDSTGGFSYNTKEAALNDIANWSKKEYVGILLTVPLPDKAVPSATAIIITSPK